MDINYEYYKIFYYAAKYRSFTRAAEALYSNQPNITRSVRLLENELGTKLFERSNKGVSLTAEGERLYEKVAAAMELIQKGEEELRAERELKCGSVSIGASETALHGILLGVLNTYRKEHPHIKITLFNHTTPQAINALSSALVDIALVTTPADISAGLTAHSIRSFREIPVCGEEFSKLTKRKITLAELAKMPLISLDRSTKTYEFYSELFLRHGLKFSPDIEAATADQILPLVKNNLGAAFLPEPFAVGGGFCKLDIAEEIPRREILLVRRTGKTLSPAAQKLCDMLISN